MSDDFPIGSFNSQGKEAGASAQERDPSAIRKQFSQQPIQQSQRWLEAHGDQLADPLRLAAWCGLSEAARQAKDLALAEDSILRARALDPDDPTALFEHSLVRVGQERHAEALSLLDEVDRKHPGLWIVQYNRAVCLERTGQHLQAKDCYKACLKRRPDHLDCALNLANCLIRLRQWEPADALLERICQKEPALREAWVMRARSCEAAGDWQGARNCSQKAQEIRQCPGTELFSSLLLPAIPESTAQIDEARARLVAQLKGFRSRGLKVSDPLREIGKVPFYLAYHDTNDLPVQRLIAETMLGACPALGSEHLHPRRKRDGRIRLGVVSAHLKAHTIGKLNVGLLTWLPDDFELIVFRPPGQDDAITRKIDTRADQLIALPPQLEEARERIGRNGCDLLFFPDLGMDALTWLLAFSRMAPVQITTWGHPDTTGIPNVDAFLSSRWYEPDNATEHYSETLLLSPELNPLYPFPKIPPPGSRASIGLPDDAHLYVFAQSLFKIHPDFDPVLTAILEADPKGKLVLLGGPHPAWSERVRRRLGKLASHLESRILLLPHLPFERFLTLLQTADVLLDAPQFCGGNTTYEAFAAGVPVVTMPGRFLKGRLTYGMYQRCGWDELIAPDPQTYQHLALRMANDLDWRHHCQNTLRERSRVLFDDRPAADAIYDLFRRLA